MKTLAVILIMLGLTACAAHVPNIEFKEVSANVYELTDEDFRGVFGSESSLIERNLLYVDEFASSRSKVPVPIEARIHGVGPCCANWAWFNYKFTLAEPNSPEAQKKFSDIVAVRDERWSGVFQNRHNEKSEGRYNDLLQLDELRKKGIISEAEFNEQKTKILNGN